MTSDWSWHVGVVNGPKVVNARYFTQNAALV